MTDDVQSDGTSKLTVQLAADNALVWVVEGCDLASAPVFGSNVSQVLQGATPTVGSATLRTVIRMGSPGDPLPDLFQILAYPAWPQSFLDITLSAHAPSELEGRRTGEAGAMLAAGYISNQFAKVGLKPGASGRNGKSSFMQRFPYVTGVEMAGAIQ